MKVEKVKYGWDDRIDPYPDYAGNKAELLAKGYRYTRLPAVKHPGFNTFDRMSTKKVPMNIRHVGWPAAYDEDDVDTIKHKRRSGPTHGKKEAPDTYYRRPEGMAGTARRHYTDTLRAFFSTKLETMGERDKIHLESVMRGQSLRESGEELGISHVAVHKARTRALDHLRKAIGDTPEAVADELVFFFQSEGGIALAARLPERVLALSRKWKGH